MFHVFVNALALIGSPPADRLLIAKLCSLAALGAWMATPLREPVVKFLKASPGKAGVIGLALLILSVIL